MFNISKETLARLREEYPVGCRVELTKMNDPYRVDLVPGCRGTVTGVDDSGSIHVSWDIRSSLAVVYGEDACKKLDTVTTVCYGDQKTWDTRKEALAFFLQAIESSEGAEQTRYFKVYAKLVEGCQLCTDQDDE